MFAKTESAVVLARTVNLYLSQLPTPEPHYVIAALTQNMEAVFEVVSNAIQLMGANGLTKECPIEKIFRDARLALMAHGDVDTLSLGGARYLVDKLARIEQTAEAVTSKISG